MNILSFTQKTDLRKPNSRTNYVILLPFLLFFFSLFCSFNVIIFCLGRKKKQNVKQTTTRTLTSKTVSLISELRSVGWHTLGMSFWYKPIQTGVHIRSHQRPVFARFIPLVLKGETLPLGPGLSSLKFEFSIASSRSCCLLIKSCDSSCTEKGIFYRSKGKEMLFKF